MRTVLLQRLISSNQGTLGLLSSPGFLGYSLELPWRDNNKGKSCIPPGVYVCKKVNSPSFGSVYKVLKVPDRSNILIHAGNLAGDVLKGFKSNSAGCILLGKKAGRLNNQLAVLISKPTVRNFHSVLNNEPFKLIIEEIYNA